MSHNTPKELWYTESHEWVKIEGDTAMVGITDFAQDQLNDIVYVELPALGTEVDRGQECAVVESTKIASDVYAPVGGVVIEVNNDLEGGPEIVNSDPYGRGWLYKLRMAQPVDRESLLDAEKYSKLLPGPE